MKDKVDLNKNKIKKPSITIGKFSIFFILLNIVSIIIATPIVITTELKNINSILIGQFLGFLIVSFSVKKYYDKKGVQNTSFNIKLKRDIILIIVSLIAMFVLIFIVNYILPEAEGNTAVNQIEQLSGLQFYILAVGVTVGAPLTEEIFFRGLLQDVLKKDIGATKSIVITSILFSLVHLTVININITSIVSFMLQAFITSIFLGYSYEKSRNLIVPIIIHSVNNTLAIISILLI